MELRLLKYFLVLVQERNISRAAEVLHLTQPTLSRQMAQLEEELGAPLFVRGKNIVLTEAGFMLRRRAEEVTSLVDKIEDEFANKDQVGGVISIGSGGLNSFRALPVIMESFRKLYPKVSFKIYSNSAEYVVEQLEQGILDFGLLLEPVDVSKFEYVRMKAHERWGLMVRSGNPLTRKKYITKEDLLNETLVCSGRQNIQGEIRAWLGDSVERLDIIATHNLVTSTIMLVEAGVASALLLEGAVDLYDPARLVFRPLYPELRMTSVFAWKKVQTGFGAAGKFLDHFKSML